MELSIIALLVYFVAIIVALMVGKLNISESMVLGFVILCFFGGKDAVNIAYEAFMGSVTDPIIASVVTFVFMAQLFNRTSIIHHQIDILNSFLGRVPGSAGYVATLASGMFGSVSHGGSANSAAIGSVAIPWMSRTGYKPATSAVLIAGNSGIGHIIPPSPSLLILLGMPAVASVIGLEELIIPLFVAAAWVMLYRMIMTFVLARRDKVQPIPTWERPGFRVSMRNGWSSLLIYGGILIPILTEVGPVADWVTSRLGETGHAAINIIIWIPVLMLGLVLILGRRELGLKPRHLMQLAHESIPGFISVGTTVLFAFAASDALKLLGLGEDLSALLSQLGASPFLLLLVIGIAVILVAGPLPASATTATIGGVAFTALVTAGVHPVLAVAAFLTFASTEGASPPAGAPIFIASGIAGNNPVDTFVRLIVMYVVPFIVLGILFGLGLLPIMF